MNKFFINWQRCSDEEQNPNPLCTSKKSFPLEKAEHLVAIGNDYFTEADHWVGAEDLRGGEE